MQESMKYIITIMMPINSTFRVMKEHYKGAENPYKSPFQHVLWLIVILLVAGASLIIVTLNNVYSFYALFAD